MKRIFSLVLALIISASLFAVCVNAETVVGDPNGVATFDPTTTGGQNINVKVEDVSHRYAVDVTFSFEDLTLGGTITWNVNTMKYDIADATASNTTRTISVSNRSDLPVYAYATVTKTNADDSLTVTADKDSASNKLTVEKAKVGTGEANGTATAQNITISLSSADWGAVATYYGNKRLASPNQATALFTVATVTVTISKD